MSGFYGASGIANFCHVGMDKIGPGTTNVGLLRLACWRAVMREPPLSCDSTTIKTSADAAGAKKDDDKLVAEKTKKGYEETTRGSSSSDRSRRNAQRKARTIYAIEGYPNYVANGHREVRCRCTKSRIKRVFRRNRYDHTIVRVEFECDSCGGASMISSKS